MKTIRVGVIGIGWMGKNHVRVLSSIRGISLEGVVDISKKNRQWFNQTYNKPTFEDAQTFLKQIDVDAVIVSTPTSLHYSMAKEMLGLGKDVLLEKPITTSSKKGEQLLKLAHQEHLVFMVGHVERFNPMVLKMKNVLRQKTLGKILQARIRRMSPYPGRMQDVGVLMDLATHDLDILRFLFDDPINKIHGIYRRLRSETYEDVAVLILTFQNNIMGTINVSWVTPAKIRDISIEGTKGMLVGNYLTQELRYFSDYSLHQKGRRMRFHIQEPLKLELEEFFRRVRERDLDRSNVTSAIEAVRMVEKILRRKI